MQNGLADIRVRSIPLKDGTLYTIDEQDVELWKMLYTEIDVEYEMKEILGWNLSNESKQKTLKGIKRHINGWLAKENRKARNNGYSKPKASVVERLTDRSWAN